MIPSAGFCRSLGSWDTGLLMSSGKRKEFIAIVFWTPDCGCEKKKKKQYRMYSCKDEYSNPETLEPGHPTYMYFLWQLLVKHQVFHSCGLRSAKSQ